MEYLQGLPTVFSQAATNLYHYVGTLESPISVDMLKEAARFVDPSIVSEKIFTALSNVDPKYIAYPAIGLCVYAGLRDEISKGLFGPEALGNGLNRVTLASLLLPLLHPATSTDPHDYILCT